MVESADRPFSPSRTLGPDYEYVDPTDAGEIMGRFNSYLKGIDLSQDGDYFLEERRVQVQIDTPNEWHVWVWEGDGLVAYLRREIDRTRRTLLGKTPVAESPIRAELVTYGTVRSHVRYELRGEEVRDDHRIQVVRRGFGFTDPV